ncbi:MAG TPA: DISARM system helicase DrmA [Planctomycetota bacterium]|jgi:hypothetical protein|nr:DISARM system helicase DrmA [Planctomycetota bacterium]
MNPKGNDGSSPSSSLEVRQRLVEALRLDLVGPWSGHALAEEKLPYWIRPSNWYLTGFLIPTGTPPEERCAPGEDEDLDEVLEHEGLPEENSEDRRAAKRGHFPSSMGLSFLVPPEAHEFEGVVRWGDYELVEIQSPEGKTEKAWQRRPREKKIRVELKGDRVYDVPDSGGLQLHVLERKIAGGDLSDRIAPGSRSVSVFLVNRRSPNKENPDLSYIFQAALEVSSDRPLVPRSDPRGLKADGWDERVADLHYADTPEFAVGHGVSADWEVQEDGTCRAIRTTWLPGVEVPKTAACQVPEVELSMDALGALQDGPAAEAALRSLTRQYEQWIAGWRKKLGSFGGRHRETAEVLLERASFACRRIGQGIDLLARDPDVLEAFRTANRAVARALHQRLGEKLSGPPKWYPYQLAFILLNLSGLADPKDRNRETVDLLYFPTGGGKTEAYLGLAAFAMVYRRLKHPAAQGRAGAGVSVIMRYTLRLLTLDQLMRASGLVCALEMERRGQEARYGTWPFEIGLWVGKAATPNIMGRKGDNRQDTARSKTQRYKKNPKGNPPPIPLEACPWCGTRFQPESFDLEPDEDEPRNLRVVCANPDCDFTRDRPLPIVAVDESIYRRLPAFLIATVDKFASLPWVGPCGVLLGGADRHDNEGFYGPAEPGRGNPLPDSLPPPDLVIQDELHLVSGPLGTLAGLYETAIEGLCIRKIGDRTVRPKIVASTATVRQAQDQVQALFGRGTTQIFPPPGPDRRDSFFARVQPLASVAGRFYLGVAAAGQSSKEVMRRVWLALLGAAERLYRQAGVISRKENPADPYMTVVGYFNSLRELGGSRRVIEEQIQNTIQTYGLRRRLGGDPGLFSDRRNLSEVLELTSRVPTHKVAEARRRLECAHREDGSVDCVLATNMISVGVDIPRLGVMVVHGQPKTCTEYIQATSRVGRDDSKPGLVVTILIPHKPRDRSHYERFRHYHETFYRSVEPGSVTPFSARALDRGLAGAMVALARHGVVELTPPDGAGKISEVRAAVERRLLEVFQERLRRQSLEEEEREERLQSVQSRIVDLLDSWITVSEDFRKSGVGIQYQQWEGKLAKALLRDPLEKDFESEHHRKFRVPRSLREVEPEVDLVLKDLRQ